jgi:hypothetical protein
MLEIVSCLSTFGRNLISLTDDAPMLLRLTGALLFDSHLPKSMIRQTGGTAVGEIPRSSPFWRAMVNARGGGMILSCRLRR